MKGFLKFILIASLIATVIAFTIHTGELLWVTLYGWVYIVIVAASVGILALLQFIVKKILTDFRTPAQRAAQDAAWEEKLEYDKQYNDNVKILKQQHQIELNKSIENARTKIKENNDKISKSIQELENRKRTLQQKVDNNTLLHSSDLQYGKIYRLIQCMESNRADSVKEALLYDDQRRELARRQQVEQEERQAQDRFRQQQLDMLQKMADDQERYNEDVVNQNEKIVKQNEELLKLEREKLDSARRNGLL